jgi:micrococcal nuclease
MWTYRARVLRVVDGDTVDLRIDLGFSVQIEQRVRLLGIDTPEINSPDPEKRVAALAAKAMLAELLPEQTFVTVVTEKDKTEKYGRYLARIYNEKVADVAAALIDKGLGVPYFGGKR